MSLKVFSKNALVYAAGTAGLRLSAFLLIPVYTHYLPLSEYGLLATVLVTIQLIVTFIDLSLREGIMRFSGDYRKKNELNYLFGTVITINILGGVLVSVLCYYSFRGQFAGTYHVSDIDIYIGLTCLAAIIQSLCINIITYYRASNEGYKYMTANLMASLLTIIISLIFFVVLKAGVKGAIIAQIISYGITGIYSFSIIFRETGIGIRRADILYMLRYCLPLMLATIGFAILNSSSTYFLSYFENLSKVGIYSLASKLSQVGSILIILPFQLAYEPYVFANIENEKIYSEISRLTTYLLLIYTVVSILLVLILKALIQIIAPEEYSQAFSLIFFLLPGLAFSGLFYIGQSLLLMHRKTKRAGIIVFVLSMCGVITNYFLIKMYATGGLILNYNISWIAIALTILVYGMREVPIKLEGRRITMIGLAYITIQGTLYFLSRGADYIYYLSGILLFAAFLFLIMKYLITQQERDYIRQLSKTNKIIKRINFLKKEGGNGTSARKSIKKDRQYYA